MSDVHVLPTDYHGGEDHLVKDNITAHKDHKRHITQNDSGVDATNVGSKGGNIKRTSD